MIVDWGQTSLIEGSQQAKSNKETDKYGSEALNNSYCCSDSTKYTHIPLSSSVRLLSNWGLTIPSPRINSPIKLLFLLVCDSFECLLFKKKPTYKLTKVIGSIQQRPGSLSFESWLLLLNVQNSRVHNLTT